MVPVVRPTKPLRYLGSFSTLTAFHVVALHRKRCDKEARITATSVCCTIPTFFDRPERTVLV
jgi:hypothetical protein